MVITNKMSALLNNTRVMLLTIIITSFYLMGIIYWQSQHFNSIDPVYVVQTLNAKEQRNTSLVQIGLHINNFPTFSFSKNTFTIDGILWFKFPSGAESIETLSNFGIQNASALNGNTLAFKSEPIIKRMGNDILLSYHIQAIIKTALDFKNFPLSKHRLDIIITNKNVSANELYFISNNDNVTISNELLLYSWQVMKASVKTGYTAAKLAPNNPQMGLTYPAAVFSINFDSIGFRDLISLYFPMFVLFLIALFCLLIDIKDTARLGYVAATVPILVLFRMVIDGVSPDAGSLTHVDFMYNLFVFLSLIILFFQTYVILRLQHLRAGPKELEEQTVQSLATCNNVVFFLILLALALGTTITFFR
ncbi:hypothetical protein FJ365_00380 [Candidatus Dependentiae bacterium]|nr:hypothetical protein [Candidatus Dependentiae bacterium]